MKPGDLQCYTLDVELRQLLSIIQNKTVTLEQLETDRPARNFRKTFQNTGAPD